MDYIPNTKQKILIVFDDILADMLSIKKLNPIAIDLFVRGIIFILLLFLSHNFILLLKKILD